MRLLRGAVLAIVVSIALMGSMTTTADAEPTRTAPAAVAPAGDSADPGDPGFPPDGK